jgi:hypothetical protein
VVAVAKELILEVVARKNSRELTALADDFEKLATKTDAAGKKLGQTTTFSKHLDDQIARTKIHVRDLATEFERTGNKEVFGNLKGAQANLRQLETIRKQLTTALVDDSKKAGFTAGPSFFRSFAQGIGEQGGIASILTSPPALAALIPAAIVAGSAVGAAAGAAVTTGLGLAGIGAALALDIKDPRVHSALAALRKDISDELHAAAAPLAGDLAAGLDKVRAQFKALAPEFSGIFAALRPAIAPLSSGFSRFLEVVVPGLERLAQASEPLVVEFGEYLPVAGQHLADLFDTMAAHEKELEFGLELLGGAFNAVIDTMRGAVIVGSAVVDAIDAVTSSVKGVYNLIPGVNDKISEFKFRSEGASQGVGQLGVTIRGAGVSLDQFQQALNQTAVTLDSVRQQATDKLLDSWLNMQRAQLSVHESLTGLTDAFKQNGRSLDITTKAGQQNREAILQVVAAAKQQYDAEIASGASSEAAAADYEKNTDALRRRLIQLGYNKAAVDALIGSVRKVPGQVNSVIVFKNLADSIDNLTYMLKLINGIPAQKISRIKVIVEQFGKIPHRAAGGPVAAGNLYEVGERGRELFAPWANGEIVPNGKTPALVGMSAGRAYGAGPVASRSTATGGPVTWIRAGDELAAALISLIQRHVGRAGGDGRTLGIVTVRG